MAAEAHLVSLAAVVATGAGAEFNLNVPKSGVVPYLIRGITDATVKVQGSLDGAAWVDILSVTADGAGNVAAMPFMRWNVTIWTSGTITAGIWADEIFGT